MHLATLTDTDRRHLAPLTDTDRRHLTILTDPATKNPLYLLSRVVNYTILYFDPRAQRRRQLRFEKKLGFRHSPTYADNDIVV